MNINKINKFIRDVCSVVPRSKSEVRRRLDELLQIQYDKGAKEKFIDTSTWQNLGKKYGYFQFFEKKIFTEYKAKSKIGLSSLLGEVEKTAYAKGKKEAEYKNFKCSKHKNGQPILVCCLCQFEEKKEAKKYTSAGKGVVRILDNLGKEV